MSSLPDDAQPGIHRITLTVNNHQLPALALIAHAPRSYTAEHTVELQLPGNPHLLERIIDQFLHHPDVRRAEPGEFTARAFMRGRISLTEAEGVAATISAQSDADLRAAGQLRHGELGDFAHTLADDLAMALALVEAGIDFTDEEDVVAITPVDLHGRLADMIERMSRTLARSVGREQLDAIPRVVLTGPPNAGKSTLFNALLGHERAVVSDVAGTTRDVIAEPLTITTDHGPAEIMLIDVAGADDVTTALDAHMQDAARAASRNADLRMQCVPVGSDADATGNDLIIRTKCDDESAATADALHVSAHTGFGLDSIRQLIADRLADRAVSLAADAFALLPRHESHLRAALSHCEEAQLHVDPSQRSVRDAEIVALSMRAALDDLAALAGDITPDDVLGRVFASFCVGK